jgi:hypothetical protein
MRLAGMLMLMLATGCPMSSTTAAATAETSERHSPPLVEYPRFLISSSSASSSPGSVIVVSVYCGSRPASSRSTTAAGPAASTALPLADACSGRLMPRGRMMRTGLDVSRRSISTTLSPSGIARWIVSSMRRRRSSITGTATSRRPSSPAAWRPTYSALVVTTHRVTPSPAGRIHPAACSARSARCTELLGMPVARASSPTPAGWRAATSSSTRSVFRTFCMVDSPIGTCLRSPCRLMICVPCSGT